MKYKPNSNLLTEQNRIVQLYLVSLLFKYYILLKLSQLTEKEDHQITKNLTCTPDRLSAHVEGELEKVPPSPSSRLRSFVAMVLGAKAPHITETSSFHNPVAKCLPPQRLLQTQLATGREEGKCGACGRKSCRV
jgi:hypothetical protein